LVFAYYNKLSVKQKKIYRQSDQITTLKIPDARDYPPIIAIIGDTLQHGDRKKLEAQCRQLLNELSKGLGIPRVRITVMAARPSNDFGELHGLYHLAQGRKLAHFIVWMRTAQRKKVVAFRTFLRTVLHEYCHHLDYALLKFEDSSHTEGFYK
jgi:hypothetical protein